MAAHSALVLVAHGCEDIETVTIIDVLRRAHVHTVVCSVETDSGESIKMANGISIVPDTRLAAIAKDDGTLDQPFDIVVLPGGSKAAKTFCHDGHVQRVLQVQHQQGKLVGAICAGPTALLGVVDAGTEITAYPGFEGEFKGKCKFVDDRDAVCSNRLITSRGPGTAMLFALTIVESLCGHAARTAVADGLLYRGGEAGSRK